MDDRLKKLEAEYRKQYSSGGRLLDKVSIQDRLNIFDTYMNEAVEPDGTTRNISMRELAKQYNVNKSHICNIVNWVSRTLR